MTDDIARDYLGLEPLIRPSMLVGGSLLSTDLARTRRLCEGFLGLQCTRADDGTLLVRNRARADAGGTYWVIEVRQVGSIENPQGRFNHWGVDVASRAEVDAAHAVAEKHKDYYGIDLVQRVSEQHGVYAFYFRDVDAHWWEVEHHPATVHEKFAKGDQVPT